MISVERREVKLLEFLRALLKTASLKEGSVRPGVGGICLVRGLRVNNCSLTSSLSGKRAAK